MIHIGVPDGRFTMCVHEHARRCASLCTQNYIPAYGLQWQASIWWSYKHIVALLAIAPAHTSGSALDRRPTASCCAFL